ncbi:hypothetical protein EDC94DRAFT_607830 [Helicostylum pulchrum]|nr:hypothetical protein EDC94DRAFT_607830 [Helicostylum pulchrum]
MSLNSFFHLYTFSSVCINLSVSELISFLKAVNCIVVSYCCLCVDISCTSLVFLLSLFVSSSSSGIASILSVVL